MLPLEPDASPRGARDLPLAKAEFHLHDVLNVFMCTGLTRDTHWYLMKASPVRPGNLIELFAEIDLLCSLSAYPGGDCSAGHSDDDAVCHPLKVEVHRPDNDALAGCRPLPINGYSRSRG